VRLLGAGRLFLAETGCFSKSLRPLPLSDCGEALAEWFELVLERHESRSADCTAGLYDRLAGLVGLDEVEEKEDFPDTVMPRARCDSGERLPGYALVELLS
jgi:hypothetical protein